MSCEITTYSTNNTSNQQLLHSFTDTTDLGIDFMINYNKTVSDFRLFPARECCSDFFNIPLKSESYELMLASERVLSRDWDSPEEDEAWADL